jgi:3-deoxy-D-manno-octulosonic-acid transferase
MYYVMYNVMLILAFPVILALLLTKKRSQRGLLCRFGFLPPELRRLGKPVVWIHAASLGEAAAIVPLLHALKERCPQWMLVVTTVTATGREVVMNQLRGVAVHGYAPVDYRWVVGRYIRILQPQLFILVESEYWPNLLNGLHRHQVPICLVNGRISSRSFGRYLWIQGMMSRVLKNITLALMQSARDAERIRRLGANPEAIHVTGNMKFDQDLPQHPPHGDHPSFRTLLQFDPEAILIVAGSTHPHEEECLLEALQQIVTRHPRVVLVMAPRHIERAGSLEHIIGRYGFRCVRRSRLESQAFKSASSQSRRVIVLDTRGELFFLYREAFITFVGGTLVPVGGHNLLEPAQWGRPVLFGPYVDHCQEIAQMLLEGGGGIQIQNQDDLVSRMSWLLANPSEAEASGKKALHVVQAHRGVTFRNLQWINRLLKTKESSPSSLSVTEPA